jgi:CubicO group peptidase (beta-lactamase class C family)
VALCVPLVALSIGVSDADDLVVRGELGPKLDDYLTRIEQAGFSGAWLVAKEGDVVLAKGYGMADREKGVPVTPDTVFDIGSITKQFTAAAILKLEMEGKLSVDDRITAYFDNVPQDRETVTIHHLLTHTSGMRESLGSDYAPITREKIVERAMKAKLLWQPGERYRYSNAGYSLLGAIVEMVSGGSYEAYLRENLFEPAGMTQTGYLLPQWKPDRLACGYTRNKDWGTPLDHRWDSDGPYWNLRANGGILSTVWDMYRWHLALKGDKILSKEAKNKMFTPHVPEEEGGKSYYGYGWVWVKTGRRTTLITHNGGNGIFFADFLRYVDEDVVILFMTNCLANFSIKIPREVRHIVFGKF